MRIPGIPGASEPTFRTRDCRWMGLDTLVLETCAELEEEGWTVSPHVAKVAIQVARAVVQGPEGEETESLVRGVRKGLRYRLIVMTKDQVEAILTAYARVISTMDIAEING
jgi:hypothetical protein